MAWSHTHAAILSTGDEIIFGQLQDTNARWIAQRLVERGITPVEHAAVADDEAALAEALRRLAARVPLIVMSGGLGPTDGDLTRAALGRVLGEPLVTDPGALEALTQRLRARGRVMTDRQARQAQRPGSAVCLPNALGTAPGLHAVVPSAGTGGAGHAGSDVFCLPGPPAELQGLWTAEVDPRLRPAAGRRILTRLLHVTGVAESDAVERMGALTARDRVPLVGVTASGGVLTIRIRYEGEADPGAARSLVEQSESAVRAALGAAVFGVDGETLAAAVQRRLRERGETLAVVESCTGGLLGKLLTDVPGSSETMLGGWITYANALKADLVGVPGDALTRHGAVSDQVASAMALGGLNRLGASHVLAITGVAGPGGGSEAKPVGTVWIGYARRVPGGSSSGASTTSVSARRFSIPGNRDDVRARAATAALSMLWFALASGPGGTTGGPLLWEAMPGRG